MSRIVKAKEKIINKTFLAMMEVLGYDVELTYVKRKKDDVRGLQFILAFNSRDEKLFYYRISDKEIK